MKNKIYHIISFLIIVLFVVTTTVSVNAYDELPAPDWIQISTNSDGSKVVSIITPSYMVDVVNYYEYSTDFGLTWQKLNDSSGGEFVFDTTTEFSLRYVYSGFRSTVYTVTVSVSKTSTITSSVGITLLIPNNSEIPTDVTLSAYEIVSGISYNSALEYFGTNKKFALYDVTIMRNNNIYNSANEKIWLFPKNDFDIEYCKIYHISENGEYTLLDSQTELNMLLVKTEKTGTFAVVEDKTYSKGDVNGDGLVKAGDARLALRYSARLEDFNETQIYAADYDNDGKVTPSDARLILRVSAGLQK